MNTIHPRLLSSVIFIVLATASLIYVYGCGGLKLVDTLRTDPSDWPTFAGQESRTNATSEHIQPPLKLAWEYDISGGIGNGSPLVVDSVLLVGNLRGELYAISLFTGKRIGWVTLGDAIQGAPAIDHNTAIVAVSNSRESLIAYNLIEGKPRWKHAYGDIEASPLLHDQRIYVGNTQGTFHCVDQATGDPQWKFEIPQNTRRKGIRSSAAAEGQSIVFGAEDGAVYAFDAGSGKLRWSHQTGAAVVSPPAIANGKVYIGNMNGVFHAIDLNTGKPVWSFPAGSSIYAGAALDRGLAIIGTTGGMIYAFRMDDGSVAWKTNLGSVINSSAIVTSNTVYVGTLKKILFALSLTDGSIVWKQETAGRIKTSPAVAKGFLFVATDERLILAFRGSSQ